MIETFFSKKNIEDGDIFITKGYKDIKLTRVDRPVSKQSKQFKQGQILTHCFSDSEAQRNF